MMKDEQIIFASEEQSDLEELDLDLAVFSAQESFAAAEEKLSPLPIATPSLKETSKEAPKEIPQEAIKEAVVIPKVPLVPSPPKIEAWQNLRVKPGNSFVTIFQGFGLSNQSIQFLIKNSPHRNFLTHIKVNQELKYRLQGQQLDQLSFAISARQELVIYREGSTYKTKLQQRKIEFRSHYLTAIVQGSLYNTAKQYHIPYHFIQKMTQVFNWDNEFLKSIHSGDRFTFIYQALYADNQYIGIGDILAFSYKNKKKEFQAIRYTAKNGNTDYFTPQGFRLKKAFIRYPVQFSHISSTFSLSRTHPVLHYRRPHKGIDLAAPLGTPVRATGDGRIESIGRHSGYGNMVKIKHDGNYSTIYAHLLKFQKGLARRDFVKQGEIIGYVGQSGLATGPHCHYEFHYNNLPRNPSTISLPQAIPISSKEIASFKVKIMPLLAELKRFDESTRQYASNTPSFERVTT